MKNITIQKFADKTAKIGIVGLGYVGLPLMLRYVDIGYQVLGFDIDKTKVDKLNKGETYIEHIPAEKIAAASNSLFEATTDFSRIGEVEAVILCVPTPLNKYREPDMSFVIDTTDAVKPYLRAGQVLSLESTTYPGTTEEELLPRVEEGGLKVGKDVFLVYSPEREDPGNPNFETRTIPKVIGGHTPEIVADKMDVDIHEVIAAAATKPFGFVAYYPGPGLGGHCIPIDPFYLTWKAREYGVNTRFIELAGEVNSHMPDYVIGKVGLALNEHNRSIKDSKILILGIAYKKNVDDMRESPSVEVMDRLHKLGANISYSDPHVLEFPYIPGHHYFDLKSEPLTPENVAKYDCVVLTTDHDKFDYDMIAEHAKLIVDTRGKFPAKNPKVVKA